MREVRAESGKARVEWIDFAKGIGILIVIIAHLAIVDARGNVVRGLAFSFHMPLFFILSGMTFRCSADIDAFAKRSRRAAKHLLTPVIFVFALSILLANLKHPDLWRSLDYWKRTVYSLIVGSGVKETFYDVQVPALGIPWFFLALFFGRTLFDYLHLKFADSKLAYQCWIVSAIGVLLGRDNYLPLSLDIALAIVPFFLVGYWLSRHDIWNRPVRLMLASLAVWLLTLRLQFPNLSQWTYLELACRRYPLYPICYLTAVAGTLFICALSQLMMKLGRIVAPIVYLGRNSMYMLIVHCFDGYWYSWWAAPGRQLVESAKRLAADLVVFVTVMLVKAAVEWAIKRARQGRASQPR